ncbi:MAG: hypothetical protein Q9Q40_14390 [Acidobacteriota bacterium]|nr:hypothetical protein [Acidobacteriota bacterium]MDQ7088898.1 hypothetical protein [Acidobacteriota bacterium]
MAPAATRLFPGGPPITAYTADEDLLTAVAHQGRGRVRLQRATGIQVVLGRSSDPAVELLVDAWRTAPIPVSRRRGGGCSVLIDPGNLLISVVLPVPGFGAIRRHFDWISTWLCGVLAACGIDGVRREGTSDLSLGGRKIGGSCIYRSRNLLYYSTTLLADPELPLIERYLAHPPREPAYRRGRCHRDFLLPLADAFPFGGARELLFRLREKVTLETLFATPLPPTR